jgi:hypothetical protein
MGDESWIYSYDLETKQCSSQWKSPNHQSPKKGAAGPEFNKEYTFLCEGIIHREFVPPNTTVKTDFYCNVLRCLRENV